MIEADTFLTPAREAGFDFYTGVPCSFLTPVINRVISDRTLDYVAAASEGEAVAIASGAWLTGHRTVVMCQNSGLGNAVNPLTSLNYPFRIPTLLIVTWRGGPGIKDEPQHHLMGPITPSLLDVIQVPHHPFPSTDDDVAQALAEAQASMEKSDLPFALIMEKGAVRDDGIEAPPPRTPVEGTASDFCTGGELSTRIAILERLVGSLPEEAVVIATTGFCGRELYTVADRPQHLYQVGSMGCASGMGLGGALNVDRPVVVLDGDGAALMKMGTMATIGAYGPGNLIHMVLDNGTYLSTGGQPSNAPGVDFSHVALACGYAFAAACDDQVGMEQALKVALAGPGPHLIHLKVSPDAPKDLVRPDIAPADVARRFKDFLVRG